MTTETMKKTDDRLAELEVMSRLLGTAIQTREICDKWLLITYDIPTTKVGNQTRNKFLKEAAQVGATQFTESVYLLPYTPEAELLALEVARVGKAVVWTSQPTNESLAREVTQVYDRGLKPLLDKVIERIDKIAAQIDARHYKMAEKMTEKTERMINSLEQAIIRRGSAELYITLQTVKLRLNSLFGRT